MMMMMSTMTSYSALSIPGMRVLFCPTSLVRTKLSNFRTDLGRRLHFSYGPLRAKERYLIPTFPPFLIAKTPTFCLVVKLFCLVSDLIILVIIYISIFFVIPQSVHFFLNSGSYFRPILSCNKLKRNWCDNTFGKNLKCCGCSNADHVHRFYMR